MGFFAGLTLLLRLGFWQMQRATEKQTLSEQQESRAGGQRLKWEQWSRVERFSPVELSGEFDPQIMWLLDNQIHGGHFGYGVYSPFCGEGRCVLVDRGWMPGSLDRSILPDVETPAGMVRIQGVVDQWPEGALVDENEPGTAWPRRIQRLFVPEVQAINDRIEARWVVRLDASRPGSLTRIWNPVVMGPAKHRGYAVQWFAMAAAWSVLWGAAVWRHRAQPSVNKQEVV